MAVPILIDTDPGLDDILAILYALHSPEVQVVALTTVHGNSSLRNTTKNLMTCMDMVLAHHEHASPMNSSYLSLNSRPWIAVGAATPLLGENAFAHEVHGDNGLGGVTESKIQSIFHRFSSKLHGSPSKTTSEVGGGANGKRHSATAIETAAPLDAFAQLQLSEDTKEHPLYRKSSRTAVQEMFHHLRELPENQLTIVCLGPLTNLAQAILEDGEHLPTLSRARSFVLMGGAIHQPTPGGNITPNAEFNFYADPKAASIVLSSGLPITLVPLDVTETCRLRYGVYQETLVPLAHHAPLPSFVTEFLMHIYDYMGELHEDLSGGIHVKHRLSPQTTASLLDVSNEVRVESPEIISRQHAPTATPTSMSSERALENMIESEQRQRIRATQSSSLAMHDPLCMGVVVDPSVVKKVFSVRMNIETAEGAATRGMCIVDGRRWKIRTNAQQDREAFQRSLLGQGPKPVDVVIRVDSDRFFEKFMKRVFGVEWDPAKHAWKELDE